MRNFAQRRPWRTAISRPEGRGTGMCPVLRHGTPKQGAIAQTESTCLASRRLAVRICLAPPNPPDRFGRSETIFRVPTGVAVAKRLTRRDVTPVIMGLNPIGHPCGYSTTRIGSSVGRAFTAQGCAGAAEHSDVRERPVEARSAQGQDLPDPPCLHRLTRQGTWLPARRREFESPWRLHCNRFVAQPG